MDLITRAATLQKFLEEFAYDALLDLAEETVRDFPDQALGYGYLGAYHLVQWQNEEACQAYERALSLEENNRTWQAGYAQALLRAYRHEEALGLVDNLCLADPNQLDWAELRCSAYGELQRSAEVLPMLDELIENQAQEPRVWAMRAKVKQDLNEYPAAIEDWNQALVLAPESLEYHEQRLWALRFAEQDQALLEAYGLIFELAPHLTHHAENLADWYAQRQAWEEAIEVCYQGIARAEAQGLDGQSLWLCLAKIYHQADYKAEAQAAAGQVLAIDYDFYHASAYVLLGDIALEQAQWETAIGYFQAAQELSPSDLAPIYRGLGLGHRALKQYEQAEQALKEWVAVSFDVSDAYYELGLLALEQEQKEQAFEYWTQAGAYHGASLNAIETHCPELKAAKNQEEELLRQERENQVFRAYAQAFEENARHSGLQRLFAQAWQVDFQASIQEALEQQGGNFSNFLQELLLGFVGRIRIEFSPQLIEVQTPLGRPFKACYRIESSEEDYDLELLVQALDGEQEPRNIRIEILDQETVHVHNLMENTEASLGADAYLVLKPYVENEEQLDPKEQIKAQLKDLAGNFVGQLVDFFSDKLSQSFQQETEDEDDEEPLGEASSDQTIPPNHQG